MINRRHMIAALPFLSACQAQGKVSMNEGFQVVDGFTDCAVSPSGRYIAISLKSHPGFGIMTFDRHTGTSTIINLSSDDLNYFESPSVDDSSNILAKVHFPRDGISKIVLISGDHSRIVDVGNGQLYSPFTVNNEILYFQRQLGSTAARLSSLNNFDQLLLDKFPPTQSVMSSFYVDGKIIISGVPGASPFDTIEIDKNNNYSRTISNLDDDPDTLWRLEALQRLSAAYRMLSVQGISNAKGMFFLGFDGGEKCLLKSNHQGDERIDIKQNTTCVRIGLNSEDLVKFNLSVNGPTAIKTFSIREEIFFLDRLISLSEYKIVKPGHTPI